MIASAEEFVRLRLSERREEYERAAGEPASSETWMEVIAQYPEMREWVAHNKTIPLAILEYLVTDPDPRVRTAVARKRKLSPALFNMLSADRSDSVRLCIVHNPKTPLNVVETLAMDQNDFVRNRAREQLQRRIAAEKLKSSKLVKHD